MYGCGTDNYRYFSGEGAAESKWEVQAKLQWMDVMQVPCRHLPGSEMCPRKRPPQTRTPAFDETFKIRHFIVEKWFAKQFTLAKRVNPAFFFSQGQLPTMCGGYRPHESSVQLHRRHGALVLHHSGCSCTEAIQNSDSIATVTRRPRRYLRSSRSCASSGAITWMV